jgi:mannose-6-phosphate isomerase
LSADISVFALLAERAAPASKVDPRPVVRSIHFKERASSGWQIGKPRDSADPRYIHAVMKSSILSTPSRVERRPWGSFSVYVEDRVPSSSWLANLLSELEATYHPKGEPLQHKPGERLTVKIIHVNANSRLSLQYHHDRTEEWYCLAGRAYAILKRGDNFERIPLDKDSLVVVPQMTVHRLGCDEESADILEVSRGRFDEADIVRLEDDYRVVS